MISVPWYTMGNRSNPGIPPRRVACRGGEEPHRRAEMKRFYIRNDDRVFQAIGWICPTCHRVVTDDDITEILKKPWW